MFSPSYDPSVASTACARTSIPESPFHAASLVVIDLGTPLNNPHKRNDIEGQEQEEEKVKEVQENDEDEDEDEEATFIGTQDEQSRQENIRLLNSLSSHLDLLTAGCLFLLPSLLPYLASALESYTRQDLVLSSSSSPTLLTSAQSALSTTLTSNSWNWQTTWVLLLPCFGVMIPLSLFKGLTMLEETSFQCPFRRWRQNKRVIVRSNSSVSNSQRSPLLGSCNCAATALAEGVRDGVPCTRIAQQPKHQQHGIMFGPTVHAIKRAWNVLKSGHSGYGPISLNSPLTESDRYSERTVVESTLLSIDNLFESNLQQGQIRASCDSCNNNSGDNDKNNSFVRQKFSVLPRPRSILLASLGVWTLLMTFSSVLGVNTIVSESPISPTTSIHNDMVEGAGGIDLQTWEPLSLGSFRQGELVAVELEDSQNDSTVNSGNSLESSVLNDIAAMLELDLVNLGESIEAIPSVMPVSQEDPFATLKTDIVIVNKRDKVQGGNIELEEFLEPASMNALTTDPEDASVFQAFLIQIEAEEQAARDQEELILQAQLEKQKQVLKATDDLVISSILNDDILCESQSSSSSPHLPSPLRFSPSMIIGLPDMVQKILNSFGSGLFGHHEPGQMFEYVAGRTELMILVVTMCLGSLLVGLTQAKLLYHQLSEQMQSSELAVSQSRVSIKTLLSCLALSGSALGLTLLIIFTECWDVPSVYFVGIGVSGMIFVHAWVPDMALQVEHVDDLDNPHGYSLVDDEEACCQEKTDEI
ncbi:hypothetical protein BGZ46_001008 [Entomortierella lignicola]|nr:hypothetical protein BGZ46_001008 [Entomortierella lignicola]